MSFSHLTLKGVKACFEENGKKGRWGRSLSSRVEFPWNLLISCQRYLSGKPLNLKKREGKTPEELQRQSHRVRPEEGVGLEGKAWGDKYQNIFSGRHFLIKSEKRLKDGLSHFGKERGACSVGRGLQKGAHKRRLAGVGEAVDRPAATRRAADRKKRHRSAPLGERRPAWAARRGKEGIVAGWQKGAGARRSFSSKGIVPVLQDAGAEGKKKE